MLQYSLNNLQIGLVVLARVGAILSVAPFFSSSVIRFRIRFIIALLLTLIMTPFIIGTQLFSIPGHPLAFGLLISEQVIIGLIIGFMLSSVFSAFQLSGQYFSTQIGFGMNEVIDPMGQVSIPVTGQFLNLIAILVFLYMNGPQMVVRTMFLSFKLLPVSQWDQQIAFILVDHAARAFAGMFIIAFKLAIPVMGTIFVITVAMGLLARVAPQMNVMMLAFPLKILVAFVILFVLTPLLISLISDGITRIFVFTDRMILDWSRALS